MGYNVENTGRDFKIKKENLKGAYTAMCALNSRNDLKSGGRYPQSPDVKPGIPHPDKWFSWMFWNYPDTCKDVLQVFDALGFEESHYDDDCDFILGYYYGKTGNEDLFLEACAPFVEPGSFVEWRGEDGLHWRHYFDGKTMVEQTGRVVYT